MAANNDWRNMRWVKLSKTQKLWFVIMLALLIIGIIAACFDMVGAIHIPNWGALLYCIPCVYTLYRVTNELNLFSDVDEDEIEDSESDEE